MKIQKKKKIRGGRVGGWGVGLGGQGGCEWRSEAFVKIKKKKILGGEGLGSGGGGGSGWACQAGWMGTEK